MMIVSLLLACLGCWLLAAGTIWLIGGADRLQAAGWRSVAVGSWLVVAAVFGYILAMGL